MASFNFLIAASFIPVLVILILLWMTNRQLNDKYLKELQRATKLDAELQAEKKNLLENREQIEREVKRIETRKPSYAKLFFAGEKG